MKVCDQLIMKRRREKGKKKNCSLYKPEINLYRMWCVGQCWEKCHIYEKKHMDEFINVSYVFINDISR